MQWRVFLHIFSSNAKKAKGLHQITDRAQRGQPVAKNSHPNSLFELFAALLMRDNPYIVGRCSRHPKDQ